jgi:spermidine synthase
LWYWFGSALLALGRVASTPAQQVVFETTTPYHSIKVVDQLGFRVLSFDGSTETRMSLRDPLRGHFEYTEFFHLAWLWNTQLTTVLMVGLGGASAQRSFEHDYPELRIETAEIDPVMAYVATEYFRFKTSPRQVVHAEDGRIFLRRTDHEYDAILMDAYAGGRYGSSLPQHLATKEFFELAARRLTTNGVLAYNVIGNLRGWRTDLLGAMYKTLTNVFPHVYLFPATETQNVVLIATKSRVRADPSQLRQRASLLVRQRRVTLPTLLERLAALRTNAPSTAARAPILTDDFAPVEGLMNATGQ